MPRQWKKHREFPIDKDLREINAFMRSQNIAYLYSRTVSKQELWLPVALDKTLIDDFLDRYFGGELGFHRNDSLNSSRTTNIFDELIYYPASTYVVILSLVGYIATDIFKSDGLFKIFSFVPPVESVMSLQPWRVLSPSFLHFGLIHFLICTGFFWWVSRKIELYLGVGMFLLLFLLSSVVGNSFQFYVSGTSLYGGLSGSFFGVIGFVLANQFFFRNSLIKLDQWVYAVAFFLLITGVTGWLDWALTGGFSAWSNWGGMFMGMLFAMWYYLRSER